MPSLLTKGDRIVTVGGRESWLKRPSMPFNAFYGGGVVRLSDGSRTVSYSQIYEEQPFVRACVDTLSHQIASLPLKVYRLRSDNERERVIDGPLPELLKRPWPRGRQAHLKQKIAFPWLLHGNSLLVKQRPRLGAPPDRLLALDWRYLVPHSDCGELLTWETTQSGTPEYVAPQDTVFVHWESTHELCGISPLQSLEVTVRSEDTAQRYQAASFDNAARGSVAITLPEGARYDKDIRDGIRDEITQAHGGVDNAMRPMIFGGGAKGEVLSHSAVEAELIDQRKLNREEVAAVYGVPQPMVGILDHATYSNISEQHKMLYMTVLRPWLTVIEETLEAHLLDGERAFEGLMLEFDLGEVLKGDAKERSLAYKTFLQAGVYTINELRKLENLPPIDHPLADQPLIPTNNLAPLNQVGSKKTGVASVLAQHLERASARDSFDRAGFKRDLAEDLEPQLGAGAEPFAEVWTQAVSLGVLDADGDRGRAEQFFEALGA